MTKVIHHLIIADPHNGEHWSFTGSTFEELERNTKDTLAGNWTDSYVFSDILESAEMTGYVVRFNTVML